ncbi:hypothetical protein ACFFX0_19090 [Citricoccus parietis]|uniref:Very short patch repair endonuclease n=1 Tax=Citricoccus parietis TaxID=592307 RepID=A0ABV5G3G2_9MICC
MRESWASSEANRRSMRGNKGRDTKPELAVRRLLHARGLRYRVNFRLEQDLRRTADLAFTKARVAVFIDGCYWHGCPEHYTAPRHERPVLVGQGLHQPHPRRRDHPDPRRTRMDRAAVLGAPVRGLGRGIGRRGGRLEEDGRRRPRHRGCPRSTPGAFMMGPGSVLQSVWDNIAHSCTANRYRRSGGCRVQRSRVHREARA